MLLHDAEEFNDNLGRRSKQDLSLSLSLGVDNAAESVIQDADSDHLARLVIPAGRVQKDKVSQTVPTSMFHGKKDP